MNASPQSGRASALPVEDRREMILDAAIPLFRERGQDVTTKQIADAAGIAEGTLFRAFPDKQQLIEAAVARFMDPTEFQAKLRTIDPAAPLEDKVRAIVGFMSERYKGIRGFMHAMGVKGPPRGRHGSKQRDMSRMETEGVAAALLGSDPSLLRVSPPEAVRLIRMLVFASVVPVFGDDNQPTPDELADFILRGIANEGK